MPLNYGSFPVRPCFTSLVRPPPAFTNTGSFLPRVGRRPSTDPLYFLYFLYFLYSLYFLFFLYFLYFLFFLCSS